MTPARARWLAAASELALAGSELMFDHALTDEAVLAVVSALARTRAATNLLIAFDAEAAGCREPTAAKEAERT